MEFNELFTAELKMRGFVGSSVEAIVAWYGNADLEAFPLSAEFEESKHPRANDGRFTSKGGEGDGEDRFGEVDMGDINSPANRRKTRQQLKRLEEQNTPQGQLKDLKKRRSYYQRQMAMAKRRGWIASDKNPEGDWVSSHYGVVAQADYKRAMAKRDEIDDRIAELESDISSAKAMKRITSSVFTEPELKDPEFDKYIKGWVEDGMIGPDDEERARKELALKKRQGLKGHNLVRAVEADWANYD